MLITDYLTSSQRCECSALLHTTKSSVLNQHHSKHCESENGNFVPNGFPETGNAGLEPLSILHL